MFPEDGRSGAARPGAAKTIFTSAVLVIGWEVKKRQWQAARTGENVSLSSRLSRMVTVRTFSMCRPFQGLFPLMPSCAASDDELGFLVAMLSGDVRLQTPPWKGLVRVMGNLSDCSVSLEPWPKFRVGDHEGQS